jgi:hypothetical protein
VDPRQQQAAAVDDKEKKTIQTVFLQPTLVLITFCEVDTFTRVNLLDTLHEQIDYFCYPER